MRYFDPFTHLLGVQEELCGGAERTLWRCRKKPLVIVDGQPSTPKNT